MHNFANDTWGCRVKYPSIHINFPQLGCCIPIIFLRCPIYVIFRFIKYAVSLYLHRILHILYIMKFLRMVQSFNAICEWPLAYFTFKRCNTVWNSFLIRDINFLQKHIQYILFTRNCRNLNIHSSGYTRFFF